MNDSVKFKRIQELAATLQSGLDELSVGKLTIEQLEMLTDHSRELYERLVVLRYKAYYTSVKGEKMEVKEAEPVSIAFKISAPASAAAPAAAPVTPPPAPVESKPEVPVNQVSLIDAIEEVTKAETAPEPTSAVKETSEESFEINVGTRQEAINTYTQQKPQESINDRLSKTVGNVASVAQKHEHTPIADLKRAITLNQRFQFSKELFKGNNQEYEVAIDRLNNTSRDEAFRQLDALKSKYSWNNESQVTQDFVELIERRYQG
jgi:hypothetical protein